MRSFSRCKDKLYTSSWCINGEKLNLLENPRKSYSNKPIFFTSSPEVDDKHFEEEHHCMKNSKKPESEIPKDYQCNKQLKLTYETVEVEDFKRILNHFYISSSHRQLPRQNYDDFLMTIDAEKIYEEFFGRYYQFLEDIPNER